MIMMDRKIYLKNLSFNLMCKIFIFVMLLYIDLYVCLFVKNKY